MLIFSRCSCLRRRQEFLHINIFPGGSNLSFTVKQMLQIVLEGQGKNTAIDEVCRKYGISRQTYYRFRRELIGTALDLLSRHLETGGNECFDVCRENELLRRKIQRLITEKARWEIKYKWLNWQLDAKQNAEYTEAR